MVELRSGLVLLDLDAPDEVILGAVRAWCEALAAEDYGEAMAMIHAPSWTIDSFRHCIQTCDGWLEPAVPAHKVTPLASARYRAGDEPKNNPWPRHVVDRTTLPDGSPYISVWFDLPIDGFWSDLTATFDLEQVGEHYVLALDMIHVM